jgi:cell fate (sporulation/competence/biofilm development) regulator YlbF (YheA/YmcA/DUF963 family)
MSESPSLVQMIRDSELVERVKTFKAILDSRPDYLQEYRNLLSLQKRLIQADQHGNPKEADQIRKTYEEKLSELIGKPVVAEYLHGVEEFNELIREVSEILQTGIR